MKVTVIGSGYVGLVTGACLAELGNQVFCFDTDHAKTKLLQQGIVPIYEPGLQNMIVSNQEASRLVFTSDAQTAIAHADICFIAVGTPQAELGEADLSQVHAAAKQLGQFMTGFKVIVNKSTVPVGTAEAVHRLIDVEIRKRATQAGVNETDVASFSVISNPEFLKEGAAIDDFMRPDRIVIGVEDGAQGQQARQMMKALYAPFNRHHERTLCMDVRSAEFTKYAANTMLATRISFMNELANLAELVGVDIEAVRKGIGSDPRIGYSFLYAGTGYGGSCFPKDIQALLGTSRQSGYNLKILEAVETVNQAQKGVLVRKIAARLGGDLRGKTFALWGLAFKPNTDDMRDAPSREVVVGLIKMGAKIQAYDPVAMAEAEKVLHADLRGKGLDVGQLIFVERPMDALVGTEALVIATEWKAFKAPDFDLIKQTLKKPLIFDGRNLYEPSEMSAKGIEYHGIGRGVNKTGIAYPANKQSAVRN
jgi:UDPglucose 6-dehydrogenase